MALNADDVRKLMFDNCKDFPKVLADAEAAIQLAASSGLGEAEVLDTSDGPIVLYDLLDTDEANRQALGKGADEVAETGAADKSVAYYIKHRVPLNPTMRLVARVLNERGFKTNLFQKEIGKRIYRRGGKFEVRIETVVKVSW